MQYINVISDIRGIRRLCRRFYSPEVKDHFYKPRNVGSFDKNDPNVGTAVVGKAACGDVIKFQVRVEDGVIKDACFKTFGCGSAIASSSYVTELIKGKTCAEAESIKNTDISEVLKLPPVKVHCSLLAEDAVKMALKDYNSKQNKHSDDNDCSQATDVGGK
ncbi:Iron-sulfur cluster assembly scaffold family protein [Babesia bovis T2Bo]|uniref:Iron-sulfur cluster assembly protein n=1 Tax=Babesia bovis TaxID=5865 RepID=A7AQE7_BABBO|nr:Iron-sulfur cluster assembly scaffold family protein [Babesia bovis T2Bo]EDO06766.1 Iron-sulfur cluster assembly scaffold family protein [Babesia bovis T2Bo]|eukprot:XP_001610334.1 iron sulfur cluster assembly protein nifU-like [Babesia bovis T2Bo]